MPGFRRRRVAPRRPAKKYGKKYGRRRFSKKRFARNNINQLTMRAPLAARLLRVKLPWVKTFNVQVSQNQSATFAFQGNAIVPYTVAGQSGSNTPAAGDSLPAGEVQYSALYDKYFINGSSIKVEAVNTSAGTTTVLLRAVLLAIPFIQGDSSLDDTWSANKAQLDAYTYEQLLAWPYAKWRMIAQNTGGASRLNFKLFRKTKAMCGLKDLRDNSQYGGSLTDGTTTAQSYNPQNGFMYYLRFFQNGSTTVATLDVTVRMSLYCTMTNREFNPIQALTAP